MTGSISSLWSRPAPVHARERLHDILDRASGRTHPLQVFFRADDIAHVDELFRRLMQTFLSHEMPLCLAVVPGWLDHEEWEAMLAFGPESPLWCWHQHGLNHSNHEQHGKKCEFGVARSREAISRDLVTGRKILAAHMGDLLYPVFTPPWNRCGLTTLTLLQKLGFKAVSRSAGAKPPAEGILPDIAVNIDLHTRREEDYNESWNNLLAEFAQAAAAGRMGIMLHHQRMNGEAFAFLEVLLAELRSSLNVSCCTFREILEQDG